MKEAVDDEGVGGRLAVAHAHSKQGRTCCCTLNQKEGGR